MLPKREYSSALVFFGFFIFVFGYGPQLPDWIRSVQTAPKSSLFASGFAWLSKAEQPPDLRLARFKEAEEPSASAHAPSAVP